MFSVVSCPECGRSATVRDRCVLESTDGPVEHVRVLCEPGHYFFMPTADLVPLGRHPLVSAERRG